MTEEDDWFEAALRDDDAKTGNNDDERTNSPATSEPIADDVEDARVEKSDLNAGEVANASTESSRGFGIETEPNTAAGDSIPESDSESSDSTSESGSDSLFEDDFASAFSNAPGAGPGGNLDFGGGFDDDAGFAGSGFGGGSGGFDTDGFDDEAFESDIPRTDIGIDGLDSMIQGGIPKRTLMVAIGNAGTGKTTFGLQFLDHALSRGESAVYVTLEESHDRIIDSATEKGWPYDEYEEDGRLAIVDVDPIEMANSLSSIRSELPGLVREFDATRLVLDSVSLLEMMYEERATRRNEIYDFTRSLKEAGVTTMLTSEASDDNPYASRHGIIEYLTDAVFILQYVRSTDDFRETRLAVEIQKIRDANHSREIKPYDITNEGISVYQQANLF
ncbi:KaiC domain-containing protein [Haladaptatus caseinilyticus]|uniref:KaiC domain-containing protein n=1 Tax=Haladaptatus caseinilyticus TaxID=2993314 RepID=UPI00224B96C6|nr:KaiC domain-containing protein [Haladaptatus caseinilyticus]